MIQPQLRRPSALRTEIIANDLNASARRPPASRVVFTLECNEQRSQGFSREAPVATPKDDIDLGRDHPDSPPQLQLQRRRLASVTDAATGGYAEWIAARRNGDPATCLSAPLFGFML